MSTRDGIHKDESELLLQVLRDQHFSRRNAEEIAFEFVIKDLFAGCKAGLVFVTAFESRRTMQTFVSHIAWESEVWIAEDPNHMIHFNGERFLGPYPDVMPTKP